MAATAEPKAEGLDMDLYSRQIGAFGLETMAKLTQMRVLIVGMGGVGVEIAKNICLAGPKRVTILDANIAEVKDMGSNFFISAEDLGSRRGASLRLLPPPPPPPPSLRRLLPPSIHLAHSTGAHPHFLLQTRSASRSSLS